MHSLLVIAVPFFAPIVIGFVAGKVTHKPAEGLAWLNFFVINVALPPLFYQVLAKTPVSQLASGRFILGTTLSAFLVYAVAGLVAYVVLGGRMKEAAIAGSVGGHGNVGYMGPGLAIAMLGAPAVAPMALISAFDTMLFFTVVPLLVAFADGSGVRATARLIVRRVVFNPFLIAIALGVLGSVFEVRLPEMIERSIDMLKVAAAPTALFALGVTVSLRPAGRLPVETMIGLAVKLVLHPLVVLVVLSLLGGFDRLWLYTGVLMAALPPAVGVFVQATQFNAYVDRASTAVLVGTAASIPTLLVWLYLLQNDLIPTDLFLR